MADKIAHRIARVWRRWYGGVGDHGIDWQPSVLIDDLRGLTPAPTVACFSARAQAPAVAAAPSGHRFGMREGGPMAVKILALWAEPGSAAAVNTIRIGVGRAGQIWTTETAAFGSAIEICPMQRPSPMQVNFQRTLRSVRDSLAWPLEQSGQRPEIGGTAFIQAEAQANWYLSGAAGVDSVDIDGTGRDLSQAARWPVTGNMIATGGTATDRIWAFSPPPPVTTLWPGDWLYVAGQVNNVFVPLNLAWAEIPLELVQGMTAYATP